MRWRGQRLTFTDAETPPAREWLMCVWAKMSRSFAETVRIGFRLDRVESPQFPHREWGLCGGNFLRVANDHGGHFSWEPQVDMPLIEFVALLASTESAFRQVT